MKWLIITMLLAVLLIAGCNQVAEEEMPKVPDQVDVIGDDQVACAQDVKECPDGNYVSRVPPECDFAPCPGDTDLQRSVCVDNCGDGVCQEMVCQGTGCPCAESRVNCPEDCE